MKPIKIKMQAFGAYSDLIIVDFKELKDNYIFLITGSTGSGKTTILDAMCFALYCRATGGLRTWKDMRNISVPDDVETLVEFEFELNKEVYIFRRSQKIHYVRGSNRREIRENHECFIKRINELEVLASGTETRVREQAEKILGLDCEQFSKVIMLPQGEFRNLLLAGSSEKARIFERLFLTDRWNRYIDVAKERVSLLKQEIDILNSNTELIFSNSNVNNVEELLDKHENNMTQLEKTKNDCKKYENEFNNLKSEFDKVIKVNEIIDKIKKSEKEKEELYNIFKISREQFLEAQEKLKLLPSIKEKEKVYLSEISELKEIMGNFKRIGDLQEEIEKVLLELNDFENKKGNLENSLNKITENIYKENQILNEYSSYLGIVNDLYEEVEKLKKIFSLYNNLSEIKGKIQENEDTYNSVQCDVHSKELVIDAIESKLKEIDGNLKQYYISSLVQELKENEPCPVCGSREHPNIFLQKSGNNTELINQRSALLDHLNEERSEYNAKLAKLEAYQILIKNLNEDYKRISLEVDNFNMPFDKVTCRLEEETKKLEYIKKGINKIPSFKEKIKLLEEKKNDFVININNISSQIHLLSIKHEKLNAEKKIICNENLPQNISINEIKEKINLLKNKLKLIENKQEYINSQLIESKSKYDIAKTNLEFVDKRLNSEKDEYKNILLSFMQGNIKDLNYYKEKLNELKESKDSSYKLMGELQQKVKRLNEDITHVKANVKKCKNISEKYSKTKRVLDLMQGKNNLKIPIKMYVLSVMLDEVLSSANIYFIDFSKGRYAISRKRESLNRQGYGGLDIEVFDAHYGAVRRVDTLSGGEMFLASLSLAFGLSDVVQRNSGAIHLDSIFIDEGFGSLDQSTIDVAIGAINKIKNMGRMVGIISHVSELRDKIMARIEVKETDEHKKVVSIIS